MTALGTGITDRDTPTTWADIRPVIHPQDERMERSIQCWDLHAKMIDDGMDQDDINEVHQLANEFARLAELEYECNCAIPEQSCRLCRAIARFNYYKGKYQ